MFENTEIQQKKNKYLTISLLVTCGTFANDHQKVGANIISHNKTLYIAT